MFKLNRMYKLLSHYYTTLRFPKPYIVTTEPGRVHNLKIIKDISLPTVNFNTERRTRFSISYFLGLNLLSWLGFVEDDEEKETELIMTLKRAVLASNREQFAKAEQMLHLALRLAQQQQNEQGITYCYDLMANVAFDCRDLDKAEKLFVSVLQRLLGGGMNQDDLKVIHISLKLARIYHLRADEEKADIGYNWCLNQIEKKRYADFDATMLYGVIQDWYAQFLLDRGETEKSLKHLKEAHRACSETKGKDSEQSMLLLNDLGITNWRAGNLESAQQCLSEAISIGKRLDDQTHVGVVNANLGLIFIEKGIVKLAEKYCKEAWKIGTKTENSESINQANYCFEQIKLNFAK